VYSTDSLLSGRAVGGSILDVAVAGVVKAATGGHLGMWVLGTSTVVDDEGRWEVGRVTGRHRGYCEYRS
jgi:hypothetical protein